MNRNKYFSFIEEKLNLLSLRIKNRGKINLLDLNIYSETFFAELINYLLAYNFKNANRIKQNIEGIDLIDETNKIIAQVSSTCTKKKIEESLKKKIFQDYSNYRFKFIAIVGEADKLRTKKFNNPYNVDFNPEKDIYDIKSFLNIILDMEISKQLQICEFIKSELIENIDIVKMDSNLTTIINILSNENLSNIISSPDINTFEIARKVKFNDLLDVELTIDDYKIYYSKLNDKYMEFDKQGMNKSMSVLSVIREKYIEAIKISSNAYEIFFIIVDKIIDIIVNSKNYKEIYYEELRMCVLILVVDAFIRCKIFKNPEGYNHVITR